MTTYGKTWVAGDTLTASDINTYGRAGQEAGYTEITATSSAFTAEADVSGLSVTWTAISGRTYMIIFDGAVQSSVANDVIYIYITTSANTHVQELQTLCPVATRVHHVHGFARETGLSGSVTYKIRAERVVGTGSTVVIAASAYPASIQVIDVGAT